MRTEGHVGQREDVQSVRRGRRLDVDNMRRVERSEGLRTLTRKQAAEGLVSELERIWGWETDGVKMRFLDVLVLMVRWGWGKFRRGRRRRNAGVITH